MSTSVGGKNLLRGDKTDSRTDIQTASLAARWALVGARQNDLPILIAVRLFELLKQKLALTLPLALILNFIPRMLKD